MNQLGRHVEHDPRSRDYAVQAVEAVAIQSVQHRRYGAPFNQGDLGSCTGNAMAGWLNTAPAHVSGAPLLKEADAVRLYEEATLLDNQPGSYPPDDTGSSGLAVAKAAKNEGRISSYKHAFSLHAALTALQTVPVITGVNWYEGFDSPDEDGMVEIAGEVRGGHEFEVVGFELATDGDYIYDGIVHAWNSWGKSWGSHGQFFFTASTWAELLSEQGDVTVPQPV